MVFCIYITQTLEIQTLHDTVHCSSAQRSLIHTCCIFRLFAFIRSTACLIIPRKVRHIRLLLLQKELRTLCLPLCAVVLFNHRVMLQLRYRIFAFFSYIRSICILKIKFLCEFFGFCFIRCTYVPNKLRF